MEKWFTIKAQNKRRWHFKTLIFLICCQLIRHSLTELLYLSNLLQIPNDHRMVDARFFDNLCSCKRSALMTVLRWSLSIFNGQPLWSSSSRLLSPLQNFLSHHYTVCSLAVPGPNEFCELSLLHDDPFWIRIKKKPSNLLFVSHHSHSLIYI